MKTLRIGMVIILFVIFVSFDLLAHGPDTLWTKTYGGNGHDSGRSIQQTSDGGFIIAGRTDSGGTYLIKTNSLGDSIWTRTYGVSAFNSVQQTTDGGYIATGYYNSRVLLVKTDYQGILQWSKLYDRPYQDRGYDVQQTSDGGYIIAGSTEVPDFYWHFDYYVIKTDANGDTMWTRHYNWDMYSYDFGHAIKQTADGGYLVAGMMGNVHGWLIKIDSVGNIMWDYHCQEGSFNSLQFTTDNGLFLVGETTSYQINLVRTDSLGTVLWQKNYPLSWGYDGKQTFDGCYIAAGWIELNQGEIYLIKLDEYGDTIWTKTYGGSDYEYGYSCLQTLDGGYIIVGQTFSFGNGATDVYLVKTNPLQLISPNGGEVIQVTTTFPITWWCEYPKSTQYEFRLLFSEDQGTTFPDTIAQAIHMDSTSWTWSVPNIECATCKIKIEIVDSLTNVKYTNESDSNFTITQIGIEEEPDQSHETIKMELKCDPNPFTSVTSIQLLGTHENTKSNLHIYDASGRLVESVTLTTDTYQLGTNLPPGIYFLKVKVGEHTETKKLIKIR